MIYMSLRKNYKSQKHNSQKLIGIFVVLASYGGTRKNNAMASVTIVLIGGMTPKIAQQILRKLKSKKSKLEPEIRPKNQTVQKLVLRSPAKVSECYLIAAPLVFPSNMGPNRHPHIAKEYPQR